MDELLTTTYNNSMKYRKSVYGAIVLAAVFFASQAKATTWMDAFSAIKIFNQGETEPIGNISASFGETLHMRIELNESSYHEFLKNGLKTEIVTTTLNKTDDPILTQRINFLDQTHLQEFDVAIPKDFIREAIQTESAKCIYFLVRTHIDSTRTGYDVLGTYEKERKVKVCENSLIVDTTPSPSSSPFLTIVSPPSPSVTINPLVTSVTSISSTPTPVTSCVETVCSQSFVEQVIKTVAIAIPLVGMIPIVFSLLNFTTAIFTTDRRRPEHWVKVIDSVTGKPVGGAIINVLTPDGKILTTWTSEAKTGNTGDLLQPGQYSFVAQKPGYIFPSVEEPMFPLQSGEFVYRSGLVDFNQSNMNTHG